MSVPAEPVLDDQAVPDAMTILTTAIDGRLPVLPIFEEMAADHRRCYGALVVISGLLLAFLRDDDLLAKVAIDWANNPGRTPRVTREAPER